MSDKKLSYEQARDELADIVRQLEVGGAHGNQAPFAVSLSSRSPRFTGRTAWDSTSSP